MINIREQIKDLIEASIFDWEADKKPKLVKSDIRDGLQDEPSAGEELLEDPENKPKEQEKIEPENNENRLSDFIKTESGNVFINTLFDVPDYTNKVALCLHEHFTPNNPLFIKGLQGIISRYIGLINTYNSGVLDYSVEDTILQLKQQYSEYRSESDKRPFTNIEKFFNFVQTHRNKTEEDKKKVNMPEAKIRPYEQMIEELTNLCIACNVIVWARLMILNQSSKGSTSILAMKDLFKAETKGKSSNKYMYMTNLSTHVMDTFFKSNNEFAKVIMQYPWGNPKSTYIQEAIADMVSPDLGVSKDIDEFVMTAIICYIEQILQSDKLDAEKILKTANAIGTKAHIENSAFDKSTKTISADAAVEENPNSVVFKDSGDLPGYSESELDSGATWEDESHILDTIQEPSEDILSIMAFNSYVSNMKNIKKWTAANCLDWLQIQLGTAEGSDGLSTILTQTFAKMPIDVLGNSVKSYAITNDKIEYINLLNTFKHAALGQAGNTFIEDLAEVIGFIKQYNLTEPMIERLINRLPKTTEDAIAEIDISAGGGTAREGETTASYTVDYTKNKAIEYINNLYNNLTKSVKSSDYLKRFSTSITNSVPPEALKKSGKLQQALGISISPAEEKIIPIGVTPKEASIGVTTNRSGNLELAWSAYINSLKEILQPSNTSPEVWGLLQPTIISKRSAKPRFAVAYPTEKYPVGMEIRQGHATAKLEAVCKDPAELQSVVNRVLLTVESLKNDFLSAKTLAELISCLSKIYAAFGDKQALTMFKSPDTQTSNKCFLNQLVDPAIAIIPTLNKLDASPVKTYPTTGGRETNNFLNLAYNILIENNKTKNESLLYNIRVLVEAEEIKTKSYDNIACYVAINTHIRARILLALVNLFIMVESLLVILRDITSKLYVSILEALKEGSTSDKAMSIFKFLSDALVRIMRDNPETEELSSDIQKDIDTLNDNFSEAEQKLVEDPKEIAAAVEKTPKVRYGVDGEEDL